MSRTPLPVDSLLPEILASLRRHNSLVIEAAPGAGKTTRVAPALEQAGFGEVAVLEPRRIAARMAARRVAEERGEAVGASVGYHVRFEQFVGPGTRIRYLTEGVLTRRLLGDPQLKDTGVVVLDEFHERHLETDLALVLLRRLQTFRTDLRLVVMSATLAGERVAAYLGGCPRLHCVGRQFDVVIEYEPESARSLEQRVLAAVSGLAGAGDVLVFLPGAAEIRRAIETCRPLADRAGLVLLPLHGDLPPEDQDRAIAPAVRQKVIFSTNVAESSITIDGVRAVVDSGLARVASDSLWNGLPRLEVRRISRAAAIQRAGRAARTAPGRVIRLFTADDFHRRPEFEVPEICRRELSQLCLDLHAAGLIHPEQLDWLDAPPLQALDAAEELLRRLDALDREGNIRPLGRAMARLPLHPRLSRLAVTAGPVGCTAAAILSSGDRLTQKPDHPTDSDLHWLIERPRERRTRLLEQQIGRILRACPEIPDVPEDLARALLRSFPDRVARRRKMDLQLSTGDAARLGALSSVTEVEVLLALDIEERKEHGGALVRLASAIDPLWLLELFPDRIRESSAPRLNPDTQRAERLTSLWYDDLMIDESCGPATDGEAATLLVSEARRIGVERMIDPEEFARLCGRLSFAAELRELPLLTEQHIGSALAIVAMGLHSVAEFRGALAGGRFFSVLLDQLGPQAARLLGEIAPERIRLPSGRFAAVEYPLRQPPSVASRLQDFFGLRETPRIARGRIPLVVHLLAPNRRPVQTTTDLAGFWERLYPQVRRELARRYPKHAWPENPYTADIP